LKKRVIAEGLMIYLEDNTQAWEMDSDGVYHLVTPGSSKPVSAQQVLLEQLARAHAQVA
jgi:polyphosphate kinase